jgi:DNA mismatch repair protein MutS2
MDYDKHLQDIVRDKRYWENKRQQIRQKEKRLEETLAKYETEMATIDKQRKEITQKAKSEAQNLLSEANAKIENTIRQIKEAQAEKERTREVRKELEEFKGKVENQPTANLGRDRSRPVLNKKTNVEKDKSHPVTKVDKPANETFKQGDNVRLKGQTATGVILELQDKQAIVAFGQLKSTVKLAKLEIVSNNQLKKEKHKYDSLVSSATSDEVRQRKLTFSSEIDVRGMRGDEALQAVTYFIDDALMIGVASVRILHGTARQE